jgi:hypothetical protein
MCDEAMDNIELILRTGGNGGGHYAEFDEDVPAVRTHLWSQPTICDRTSYRAKMGISRMKWKCVPGEHNHMSETCPRRSTFLGGSERRLLTGQSDPAPGTYIIRKKHQRRLHAHRIKNLKTIPRPRPKRQYCTT